MAKFVYLKYFATQDINSSFEVYESQLKDPYVTYINVDNIERISIIIEKDLQITPNNSNSMKYSKKIRFFFINTTARKYYVCPEEEFTKFINNDSGEEL